MVLKIKLVNKSSPTPKYRYDVFLNFRGVDTRLNFIDHLDRALVEKSVNTFLDDRRIQNGEKLAPELEDAIKASRVSIVVLSPNYAASTWCLDELVFILEQRRTHQHTVIPIFYSVQPSDVRNQQNTFGEAFRKHESAMEAETDTVKKIEQAHKLELWKEALTEVSLLRGMNSSGWRETLLIDEIVREIIAVLDQLKEIELLHLNWWESLIRLVTKFKTYAASYRLKAVISLVLGASLVLYIVLGNKFWIFGSVVSFLGARMFDFLELLVPPNQRWQIRGGARRPLMQGQLISYPQGELISYPQGQLISYSHDAKRLKIYSSGNYVKK